MNQNQEGNKEQKTTFTKDDVEQLTQEALNKYKSDQEKWVQKLIEEKKFLDKVLYAVGEVAGNPEKLIEISESDPEVANDILNKYYSWMTIEDYKEQVGYKESPEIINEKLIERKAKSIVEDVKIKDTKKAFIRDLWLSGDELEAFEEEFNNRRSLKSFSVDKLDDSLTKAYIIATGNSADKIKKIKSTKIIASAASVSWNTKTEDSDKARAHKEVSDLLDGRI